MQLIDTKQRPKCKVQLLACVWRACPDCSHETDQPNKQLSHWLQLCLIKLSRKAYSHSRSSTSGQPARIDQDANLLELDMHWFLRTSLRLIIPFCTVRSTCARSDNLAAILHTYAQHQSLYCAHTLKDMNTPCARVPAPRHMRTAPSHSHTFDPHTPHGTPLTPHGTPLTPPEPPKNACSACVSCRTSCAHTRISRPEIGPLLQ